MFGIGTGELLLILVIAMLVVGPERMVDYARRGGRLLVKIREQTDQVTKDFREALEAETGELKEANPLAAIAELKAEADAAARDIQNVLSGKPIAADPPAPTTSVSTTPADTAPQQPAGPQAESAQPTTDEVAAADEGAEPVAEPVTELEGVELIDDDMFTELGGPELVDEAVDHGADSEERL
ncbi:MAG: twin-arginine translocase TatA/TatE family subunit [Anaerolineae bacterium]|jgi:sec-independent protein translocase protein TatB